MTASGRNLAEIQAHRTRAVQIKSKANTSRSTVPSGCEESVDCVNKIPSVTEQRKLRSSGSDSLKNAMTQSRPAQRRTPEMTQRRGDAMPLVAQIRQTGPRTSRTAPARSQELEDGQMSEQERNARKRAEYARQQRRMSELSSPRHNRHIEHRRQDSQTSVRRERPGSRDQAERREVAPKVPAKDGPDNADTSELTPEEVELRARTVAREAASREHVQRDPRNMLEPDTTHPGPGMVKEREHRQQQQQAMLREQQRQQQQQQHHQHHQHHQQQQQQQGGMLQAVLGSFFSPGHDGGQSRQAQHIEYLSHQCHMLSQQLGIERSKNDSLSQDLRDLKAINDQFASELREMQVKSFKEIVKVTWTPVEDTQVANILADLHKEIEDWADEHCIQDLEELKGKLDEEDAECLVEFLQRIAIVKSTNLDRQIKRWIADGTDPVLLLTAILTHLMYDAVFSNSFQIMDGILNVELKGNASAAMSEVFDMLLEMNPQQAHQWRTLLMRALLPSPPSGGRFEHINPAKQDIIPFLQAYCEDCVGDIETTFPHAFLNTEALAPEARTQLVDIWMRAAELFTQLQTQLSQTVWSDPSKHTFVGHSYNEKGRVWVQAHRCQAFPEGRIDGKPISLVIAPYVAFIGNDDGERYQSHRVVSKAIILCGDQATQNDEADQSSDDEEESKEEVGITETS